MLISLILVVLANLRYHQAHATVIGESQKRDDQITARNFQVDTCQLLLVALKASAFCSSFVPIKDITSTKVVQGTTTTVTLTTTSINSASSCTITTVYHKRDLPTNDADLIKKTEVPRMLQPTPMPFNMEKKRGSTGKCQIQGVPAAIGAFECDIITQACKQFVHPKTISTTSTASGPTVTQTKTTVAPPACPVLNGFEFQSLGCYLDNVNGQRILSGYLFFYADNTPGACGIACLSSNYGYSAVENGGVCLCGSQPAYLIPGTGCNTPCAGDDSQICGGTSYVNLATYIGQYQEGAGTTDLNPRPTRR